MTQFKGHHWDRRYTYNLEQLSRPVYSIVVERDVAIPMRDGVTLRADVFRPDSDERFPALVAVSAYGKDPQSVPIPQQPGHSPTFDHFVEAGNIEYFVSRGYAYVIPDLRGVGKSEGEWHGFYSVQDQQDTHDVIEWVAQQQWCTGKVGMMGHSYFGVMQMLAAGERPKSLKAIAPIETFVDFYRRAYPGGITSTWYWFLQHYCVAHSPILTSERRYSREELEQVIAKRRDEPDIASNTFLVREFNAPKKHPAYFDLLLHPNHGPFWAERSAVSKYEQIQVPVYLAGFWGYYGYIDGTFDAFSSPRLKTFKKAAVLTYGTSEAKLPLRLYDEELLRWYDYWLKDIDTGLQTEPPIKILVTGTNRIRFEQEWPLARTQWTKLYLRRYGELSQDGEEHASEPDVLVHAPPTVSTKPHVLVYRTRAFRQPVEFTGPVALYLYASLDSDDLNFVVTLYDAAPDGTRRMLTKGYLRAAHRKIDPERSTPAQPHHTYADPEPVPPGVVCEFPISLSPIAHCFQPGHRMELAITTYDSFILPEESLGLGATVEDKMTAMGIVPNSKLIIAKIHRDSRHRSHLVLPLIRDTDPEQWLQPVGEEGI